MDDPPTPEGECPGYSGVSLVDRYGIQIPDNRDATGDAGAVYVPHPAVDVSTPPGQRNSFDIIWHPPRFDGEQLESADV